MQNNTDIINISKCVHGYSITTNLTCHPRISSLSYDNLVTTTRLVVHNGSIIKMVIYSWS